MENSVDYTVGCNLWAVEKEGYRGFLDTLSTKYSHTPISMEIGGVIDISTPSKEEEDSA